MTEPRLPAPACYRAAQVARMLHCSEWWIKEQARRGRIPYAWIGGSYLFTAEHIAAIVRRFEVAPADHAPARNPLHTPARTTDPGTAAVVQLRARIPRRARTNATATDAAA